MTKRRRALKKLKTQTKEDVRLKKYNEVKKLSQKANARIRSLNKKHKSGTWATRNLELRLSIKKVSSWETVGRIKVKKGLSVSDLKIVEKAINQFLESKTSTNKGINEVKENVKKGIENILKEDEDDELSDEDADMFYSMLSDDSFSFFADKVGASTVWTIIDDSIEHRDTDSQFLDRIERYIATVNDLDVLDKVINLYDKYIVDGISRR